MLYDEAKEGDKVKIFIIEDDFVFELDHQKPQENKENYKRKNEETETKK
ncbi:hypothetical protein HXA32_03000 [Salipaludibacillus agaradhaerens]|jgi:hypothetical protein|nr:hypothetical protein [Salipaludibacillus agaradhaerens]MCR6105249.1 hypothetical protein [Salipaludibacillus agaradhaerens]